MFMTRLPALAALAVAAGLSTVSTVAAVAAPPDLVVIQPAHPFSAAQRAQLAEEAGISPAEAKDLTIDQLAWMKEQRDNDNRPWVSAPAHVNPAEVHG